ncbi:putative glycosyl hydrolase [Planoprotostelium fungivorum]|uniref:Putative glycosyl hydrolase n=1 Tax=Planoprotostelium fungivorum TaxID=1890364 RepID=A0A2P6NNQ1_9EUKA|nr:putative glycosyl hydrolase [Planoprotostelium fungivorum]
MRSLLCITLVCWIAVVSSSTIRQTPLYEDFSTGGLSPSVWKIGKKVWGGYADQAKTIPSSGGVVPENVKVVKRNKAAASGSKYYLRLEAHGNKYQGNVYGIDFEGERRTDEEGKKRVGAVIATQDYFASGAYEVRAKLTRYAPDQHHGGGVCNAFWTFSYQSFPQGDPQWKDTPESHGGDYVKNHEIDIEIPGGRKISFNYSLLTYWQGVNGDSRGKKPYGLYQGQQHGYDEFISIQKDNGKDLRRSSLTGPDGRTGWHVFRFEWHTVNGTRHIRYVFDGVEVHDSKNDDKLKGPLGTGTTGDFYVPFVGSRFWLGVWFPYSFQNHWTGEPEFDVDAMLVDYVKIEPYNEAGDVVPHETGAERGWAATSEYPKRPQ